MRNALLIIQAALVAAAIGGAWYLRGDAAALAALYGGAVALLNTLMLSRRLVRAGELAKTDPQRGVYSLYFGAVQRFVFVLAALAVGLGLLKLDPLPLLASFALAQLAYLVSGARQIGAGQGAGTND